MPQHRDPTRVKRIRGPSGKGWWMCMDNLRGRRVPECCGSESGISPCIGVSMVVVEGFLAWFGKSLVVCPKQFSTSGLEALSCSSSITTRENSLRRLGLPVRPHRTCPLTLHALRGCRLLFHDQNACLWSPDLTLWRVLSRYILASFASNEEGRLAAPFFVYRNPKDGFVARFRS